MKNTSLPQIGFVAQEVKLVIPELVEGIDGSMTLSYGNMSAVLAKAIQELKAANDNLNAEMAHQRSELQDTINSQDAQIEFLRREIEALKATR